MGTYKLTERDRVWNRACGFYDSTARLEAGDRALRALLQVHSLTCNGGVFHALECLSAEEIDAARAGYCYFGLPEVAAFLTRSKELLKKGDNLGELEADVDREYCRYVPDDSVLAERFEKHYDSHPADFAPLAPEDMVDQYRISDGRP